MHLLRSFRKNIDKHIVALSVLLLLSSCVGSKIKKQLNDFESGTSLPSGMTLTYPQNETLFPPEFPAPTFLWADSLSGATKWSVFITDGTGNLLIEEEIEQTKWKPDETRWEAIKLKAASEKYYFTAFANASLNGNIPSCRAQFSFSTDSVGADIFYRAVTLPFSYAVANVNTIEWYMGSVKGGKPRKMLDNLPVCGNCHSFSTEQPLLAMDVDYGNDKGSYIIANAVDTCKLKPENVITWSEFKRNDGEPTYGLLSQISPSGNHVLSTVKDLSIFVAIDNNFAYSQLFFPIKGIIGIYDRTNGKFSSLPGANNEDLVQSNPSWTPDGQNIVFARTGAYVNEKVRASGRALLSADDVAEFSSGGKPFKYDLYSLPFNNGSGGQAVPLNGASNNGKSNYFPKFSPDGKWVVFCQAENFMLLQPDSRLYIMPAQGGKARKMNCNMNEMNSWHSWSPNSKWLVFSSKNRGPYTQLYLTHIDENGNDSPPVLLENLTFDKRAANIPEFFPFNSEHFKAISDEFSQTAEYFNRGAFDKMSNKLFESAFADLKRATAIDSNYLETFFNRIMLNNMLRQTNSKSDLADKQKAMQLVLDSLAKKPNNENFLSLKITLLSNMGKLNQALAEAEKAIKLHPSSYKLYDLLSTIYRKQNQFDKAIDCYQRMIDIDPNKQYLLNKSIISANMSLGQNELALKQLNRLISDNPQFIDLRFTRAQILLTLKQFDEAKTDIDVLLSKDADNYAHIQLLAQYYIATGNQQGFAQQREKGITILSQSFDKNPQNVEILFELASLHSNMRDYDNALKKYNIILSKYPQNYEALKQSARLRLNLQQWDQAISIYEILETNYNPEEEFLNNKAIAYIQIGNYHRALEYFEKLIEIDPYNKDAVYNRNRLKKEHSL